jgi:uncharacterized membrane protein
MAEPQQSLSAKQYVATFAFILLLDFVWLSLQRTMYGDMVKRVQLRDMRVRLAPAVIAYALVYAGLVFLVLPPLMQRNISGAALWWHAGLHGLVVYGVYNATNLAVFERYPWSVALIDTAWGVTLHVAVAWLVLRVRR